MNSPQKPLGSSQSADSSVEISPYLKRPLRSLAEALEHREASQTRSCTCPWCSKDE